MKKIFLLIIGLPALFCGHSQTLDPSFAGKGYAATEFLQGNLYFEVSGQALAKGDGTYYAIFQINGYTVIAHYLAKDGVLDVNFGTGCYAEPTKVGSAKAVLQSDGKIVVAGQTYNGLANQYDVAVVRYNANGTLDKTFGAGGLQTTDFFGNDDWAQAVALDPDGKIVVAGFAYNTSGSPDFALARYNTNGKLDKTFDGDGKVTTDFANGYDQAQSISLEPNGKIVVAGQTYNENAGHDQIAVARYNANGSLDHSFSGDGKKITDISGRDSYAYGVVVQHDGKIVLAGQAGGFFAENSSIVLVRYNTNGALDKSFNGDGKVTTDFSDSTDGATAIALQSDGKIVIGGQTYNAKKEDQDFILARYNTNGTLDRSFGKNGKVHTDFFKENDYLNAISIQPDGKILASGEAYNPKAGNLDFVAAQYNADGSPDRKFGCHGKLTGYYEAGDSRIYAVAVQPDGKVVVAGDAYAGKTLGDFAVARYNANGTLDKCFNGDGKVTTDFLGDYDAASAVAIQPDGKIVVAGQAFNPATNMVEFAVVRYNADGSLDKKFGRYGKLTTHFFGDSIGNDNYARAIALQVDGKIVVAGYAYNPATGNNDFALARYTTQGLPDNTFAGDGKRTTDFSKTDDFANAVAIQSDGKIVAAGYQFTQTASDFALARYNVNGSLDHSFGGDGKVETTFASDVFGLAMAIQPDGKVVVGGFIYRHDSNTLDFALARYNTNGTLDKTFDGDGKQTTDFAEADNSATALALQPDGKILLAGTVYNSTTTFYDVELTRYNTNGTLDKTFDDDGTLTTHLFGFTNYATGLVIKGNKAYVSGYTYTPAGAGFVAAYQLGLVGCAAPQVNNASAKESLAKEGLTFSKTFVVKVQPNPSTQYFMLLLQSEKSNTVNVRISDAAGRLIETKTNVATNTTLQIGQNYTPGVYYAEIIQDNQRTVVTLVKQ